CVNDFFIREFICSLSNDKFCSCAFVEQPNKMKDISIKINCFIFYYFDTPRLPGVMFCPKLLLPVPVVLSFNGMPQYLIKFEFPLFGAYKRKLTGYSEGDKVLPTAFS